MTRLEVQILSDADKAKLHLEQQLARDETEIDDVRYWRGGLEQLQGIGPVRDEASFESLCRGATSESSERVLPFTNEDPVGLSFFYKAPKTVAALYGLTGDHRIADAMEQAALQTMARFGNEATGRDGIDGIRGEDDLQRCSLWTVFPQFWAEETSNGPQPALAVGAFLFNATLDLDSMEQTTVPLVNHIHSETRCLEALFSYELRRELHQTGHETRKAPNGSWEVDSLPRRLEERFIDFQGTGTNRGSWNKARSVWLAMAGTDLPEQKRAEPQPGELTRHSASRIYSEARATLSGEGLSASRSELLALSLEMSEGRVELRELVQELDNDPDLRGAGEGSSAEMARTQAERDVELEDFLRENEEIDHDWSRDR